MKLEQVKVGASLLLLAAVGYALWRASSAVKAAGGQVVEVAKEAAWSVSPTNSENALYSAATKLATGHDVQDKPLGVSLWETLNPGAVEREAAALANPVDRKQAPAPVQKKQADGADWSVGVWLWEALNPDKVAKGY